MKNSWTAPRRVGLVALLAATAVRCGSEVRQYTPAQDDEAIAAIERRWSGTVGEGPFSITFCEDRAANDAETPDGCQVEHVVKGGGRTVPSQSEEPSSVGCGGCPFMVRTSVTALVVGPDSVARNLKGVVAFGSAYDGDPFAGDWAFQVDSPQGEANPITVEGRIQADGSLLLAGSWLYLAGYSKGTDDVTVASSAPATCVRGD